MKSMYVTLNTIDDVKELVFIASCFDCKTYIQRAEYIVPATSELCILGLDLSKVLCFISEHDIEDIFYKKLKKFSVE